MPKDTFHRLKEEKKNRIIHAALHEFTRVPIEKATIQGMVDEAGIPKGSFYQYFNSIEDLFCYCVINIRKKIITSPIQPSPEEILNSKVFNGQELSDQMLDLFLAGGTLSKDEVDFLNNYYETCPYGLKLLTICDEATFVQYPYWKQYFRQHAQDTGENDSKLLSFLFSMLGVLTQEYARAESLPLNDAFDSISSIFDICMEHYKSEYSGQSDQCNELDAIKKKRFSNLRLKIENTADISFKLNGNEHINITSESDSTLCIEASCD